MGMPILEKNLVRDAFRGGSFNKREALSAAKTFVSALEAHGTDPNPENETAMWTAAAQFRSVPGHRAFERQNGNSAA
jgi:hypothetical protein